MNHKEKLFYFIDKGFEEKNKNNLQEAINSFKEALKLQNDVNFEISIVFDIAAMLQELGEYTEAIQILTDLQKKYKGLIAENRYKEIITNLKYIELIFEILNNIKLQKLPLSKIPTIVKVSANEKLDQWKVKNC